jgi:hypothetical protein
LPLRPLFSLPRFISCISRSTSLPALGLYLREELLFLPALFLLPVFLLLLFLLPGDEDFLLEDFFGLDLLLVDFFVPAFFVLDFVAEDFFGEDFFAADFLLLDFFAEDFFVAFLVAMVGYHLPRHWITTCTMNVASCKPMTGLSCAAWFAR